MSTLPQRNTDELTVQEAVNALVCIASQERDDQSALSLKAGFIDGISDRQSCAEPGADPRSYAAGYAFGAELVDLLRWTHEIQAETEGVG